MAAVHGERSERDQPGADDGHHGEQSDEYNANCSQSRVQQACPPRPTRVAVSHQRNFATMDRAWRGRDWRRHALSLMRGSSTSWRTTSTVFMAMIVTLSVER